jgi:hypothetical protein
MLKRLSFWLSVKSTGGVALLSVVIFGLFTVLVLPVQTAISEQKTPGTGSPDLSFYYSAADLYQMTAEYGEQGRAAYIQARVTFDLVWPLVYTFFLVSGISWLISQAFPGQSVWQEANLLPVTGMIFDYLENISTSLVMWRYPVQTPIVAGLAGIFTALKWILIAVSVVILVFGVLVVSWHWLVRIRVNRDSNYD